MKTKLTAETSPVRLPLMTAANDDACGTPAIAQPAPAAWDPHDVWRTRILPYQRQLRARAEAASKR